MLDKPTDEAGKVLDHLISKLSVTRESLNTKAEVLDVQMEYTDFVILIASEMEINELDCMNLMAELEAIEAIYVNISEPADTYIETIEIPTY